MFTITEYQAEQMFDKFLNEEYGTITLFNLDIISSDVFKEKEPIRYKEEMYHYIESLSLVVA